MVGVTSTRTWRRLAVWMHVLTSVGWMTLAMVLTVTLTYAVAEPAQGAAILATAHHLDAVLLAALANGSALTGIVLSATTAYGFFHHWWVSTKFAITLGQLYLGIFVLSAALDRAASAPGGTPPSGWLLAGTVLMASAIAFQAWLSLARPWGRIGRRARPRPPAGPNWPFAAAVLAAPVDLALGVVVGDPMPVTSVLVLLAVLGRRAWVLRRSRPRGPAEAAGAAGRAGAASGQAGSPAA